MTMKVDLIWRDDGEIEYRASCGKCPNRSEPLEDEDAARASWFGHVCIRSGSPVSA